MTRSFLYCRQLEHSRAQGVMYAFSHSFVPLLALRKLGHLAVTRRRVSCFSDSFRPANPSYESRRNIITSDTERGRIHFSPTVYACENWSRIRFREAYDRSFWRSLQPRNASTASSEAKSLNYLAATFLVCIASILQMGKCVHAARPCIGSRRCAARGVWVETASLSYLNGIRGISHLSILIYARASSDLR
jgi:hypothetical protein